MSEQYIRYASTDGLDSNDGTTPARAKRTISNASSSLPQVDGHGVGAVLANPGRYTEVITPIPIGNSYCLKGSGNGNNGATRIILGPGRNTPLFNVVNPASQNHGLQMEDFILDGNKSAQSTTNVAPLLKLAGGYNCQIVNIGFTASSNFAWEVPGGYMTIKADNLAASKCGDDKKGGFLYCGNTQSGGMFSLDVAQIDECGLIPIVIQYVGDNGGPHFKFTQMKFENQTNPLMHKSIIEYRPRVTGVGHNIYITVNDLFAYNSRAIVGQHEAVISEINNPGRGAWWDLTHIHGSQHYKYGFASAKTGEKSDGPVIKRMITRPPDPNIPLFETNGVRIYDGRVVVYRNNRWENLT